jgi:AbrB family looped-hinge helix DNA binding protein
MSNHTFDKGCMDMVTLGERGQVVIPAVIREHVNLKPGDKLMVFTKHGEVICLVPASSMRHLVDVLSAQLAEIDDVANQNGATKPIPRPTKASPPIN